MNLMEFYNRVSNNYNLYGTIECTIDNYKLEVEYTNANEEHWRCYEITLTDTDYNSVIFQGHVDTDNKALLFKLIEACYSLMK
jgi:hypothetical protein